MKRLPQVSARIAGLILASAAARGVDADVLAALADFDRRKLADPDASIPLEQEERLWDAAAAATGDDDFGLHAAASLRPGAFDVLDYVVRTAPDLRQALERLVRYNRLVHDLAEFRIIDAPAGVRVEHAFNTAALVPCRHASEFTLGSLVLVASQLTQTAVSALRVEFAHCAPSSIREHERIFRVRPEFGARVSALTLSHDVTERRVAAADPTLSRIVTAHADALLHSRPEATQGVSDQVRRCVAECLAKGVPPLADIAKQLHLSERTLQRRLSEDGTGFADLVDDVRRQMALRYVADPRLSLGEVAYLVGFAESSPFHRAFKRWTGKTATAMRATAS